MSIGAALIKKEDREYENSLSSFGGDAGFYFSGRTHFPYGFVTSGSDHRLRHRDGEHLRHKGLEKSGGKAENEGRADHDQANEEEAENGAGVVSEILLAGEAVDKPNDKSNKRNGPEEGITDVTPRGDVIGIATIGTHKDSLLLF